MFFKTLLYIVKIHSLFPELWETTGTQPTDVTLHCTYILELKDIFYLMSAAVWTELFAPPYCKS